MMLLVQSSFHTTWASLFEMELQPNSLTYARHFNPRFVFFLPQFSLRFIFESGLYCREVSIYMILFSSKFTTKNRISKYYLPSTYYLPILFFTYLLTYLQHLSKVKFIHSEKATKFCEIFIILLTTVHTVKRFRKILCPSQNILMNFTQQ